MNATIRLILGTTMSLALLFGFIDPIWPEAAISYKRLHVFLFNLVAGGSIIVYFTEGQSAVNAKTKGYFFLALLYAISAAIRVYWLTLLISIPLFTIVESARIKRFSLLPRDFFRPSVSVSDKFHQASVLCLSIGIVIASLVILNTVYFPIVSYEKLTLDVFFLGYSFPISLITMSVMFSFVKGNRSPLVRLLEDAAFWLVNLGVIVFFLFIIVEMFYFEITVAVTLCLTVGMIFILFIRNGAKVQQKTFLTSGMSFLLLTAVTGVLYILYYFVPGSEKTRELFLVLHATVSLYGWNLSGLIIIIRWKDFPIKLNSALVITLHWIIVLILTPFGKYFPIVSLIAVPAYVVLLALVFMSAGQLKGRQI